MSDSKERFLDIAAEADAFCNDVDLAFKPIEIRVGEYVALLTKLTLTTVQAKNVEQGLAKVYFQILDGVEKDKEFVESFWFPVGAESASMDQRRFLLLARCVAQRAIRTIREGVEVINSAAGSIALDITISEGTSKAGNKFHNVLPRGISSDIGIEAVAATEEVAQPI